VHSELADEGHHSTEDRGRERDPGWPHSGRCRGVVTSLKPKLLRMRDIVRLLLLPSGRPWIADLEGHG
jgi:hypothetical protein